MTVVLNTVPKFKDMKNLPEITALFACGMIIAVLKVVIKTALTTRKIRKADRKSERLNQINNAISKRFDLPNTDGEIRAGELGDNSNAESLGRKDSI